VEGEFAALVVCCMVQTPVVDLLYQNDLTLSTGKPEKDKKLLPKPRFEPQGVRYDV